MGSRHVFGKWPLVRAVRCARDGTRPGLACSSVVHGRSRFAGRHRFDLYGRQRASHLRARPQRFYPVGLRPPHAARNLSLDWRSAVWLWPYLLGMGAISYLSSFDTNTPSSIPLLGLHGPRNELTFGWDILVVAVFSLVIYALAIRSRLPAHRALEY